ncbi:hypothetical protein ESY86_20640 [Subsaximicrobium wynnwilliamsii]|jgi:hypothetical protein|uniref:Uncharacterized protein n=1 Tax=Subsaximicrobium wynnwilliamsii TaxID=291179 RepID=A0A5C6ZBG6_9FLAO|nr:hypothetical protein [Subsaximicrobium wynnwilliamsii]TXD80452.1 hypothetical protein ESY87_20660 [Subsaximicrobium wynnwilliamsii]TXD86054.1 hypothetical protein ESY86_20640 [Subsaximicrobium wynnwilliamsii]TXD99399.1 hypothetical protein ESY88_20605 [Subsaximicrobium wynnwilliamsii]
MRNILTSILILCFIGVKAQHWSDINEDLGITDTLNYPTEIRIYAGGGITNYTSLFRMYKSEPDNWTSEFYEHWSNVNGVMEMKTQKKLLSSKSEMEYVYLNLFRSYIFELPNRSEIDWKLAERGVIKKEEKRYSSKHKKTRTEWDILTNKSTDLDGTSYFFKAKNRYMSNEFEFGNPFYYRDKYPEIDEPKYVCELIEIIRSEFEIWEE